MKLVAGVKMLMTGSCRFIAAEKPPHLKAIAPWEGIADHYRELIGRGGVPNDAFVDYRSGGYCGEYPCEPLP